MAQCTTNSDGSGVWNDFGWAARICEWLEWRVGSAAQKAPGIKESFPGFIEPALASSIDKVPGGSRWIHEIKFDGYRVQVHVQNGQVKVFTRRGNDWRNASGKSPPMPPGLTPARRSSMASWSCRRPMA